MKPRFFNYPLVLAVSSRSGDVSCLCRGARRWRWGPRRRRARRRRRTLRRRWVRTWVAAVAFGGGGGCAWPPRMGGMGRFPRRSDGCPAGLRRHEPRVHGRPLNRAQCGHLRWEWRACVQAGRAVLTEWARRAPITWGHGPTWGHGRLAAIRWRTAGSTAVVSQARAARSGWAPAAPSAARLASNPFSGRGLNATSFNRAGTRQ